MSEDYNKQLAWHETETGNFTAKVDLSGTSDISKTEYPPIRDYQRTGIETLDKGFPRGKINVCLGAANERPSKTTMMMDLMFKHSKDIIVSPYLDMEMSLPHSDNTVLIDSLEKSTKE